MTNGELSDAQLETIVYANMRFGTTIQGGTCLLTPCLAGCCCVLSALPPLSCGRSLESLTSCGLVQVFYQ